MPFPTLNEGDVTSESPFLLPLLPSTTMPPQPALMQPSSYNNSLGNSMMLLPIPPYKPGMVASQSKVKVGLVGERESTG